MHDTEATRIIAANLQRILDERGLSQRDLSRMTGEPPMSISRLINGKHQPGIGILTRVAEALCVTVDTLVLRIENNSRQTA